MLKEFKEFAMKGNMLDLAIGFILGAAFGTVVKSMVADIIMPVVATILGSPDFTNLFVLLKEPMDTSGVNMASIEAGLFLNALISFLIMAAVLFVIVRNVNRLKKAEEAVEEAPAGPTQEELLVEIRDLLKRS
ncbi:UNVERIFIED_CONTAM: hypothetical protein GTU68_007023 [Idotea baltica]|nr:hypothetical protein [Idotea baltica]